MGVQQRTLPCYGACARGWCETIVSSSQGKSISNEAGSRNLCSAWTLSVAMINCALKIARLLRSPRAPCRDGLWLVGWWVLRIWEPTSRLWPPPFCGRSLRSTALPRPSQVLYSGSHPRSMIWAYHQGPTLIIVRRCLFTTCFYPLLCSCMWLISTVLIARKHESIPTQQFNWGLHQLGLTWWAVLGVSCMF